MMWFLDRAADRLRDRARRRTLPAAAANGKLGEDLAHRLLDRSGFVVVARNYRPPSGRGEIDIVAWEGDRLAIVEVKTRSSEDFGSPDSAVDPEKRDFILRSARDYARRADVPWEQVRFDIVSVVLSDPPHLELKRDAFHSPRQL